MCVIVLYKVHNVFCRNLQKVVILDKFKATFSKSLLIYTIFHLVSSTTCMSIQ